jgi:predicted DNA-binding ribbon-helix-helix protein
MSSTVKKRSIIIDGHKTSISLEDNFWTSLKHIAYARRTTVSDVIASLDAARENGNLSSAIRVFVLAHYRAMSVANPQSDQQSDHEHDLYEASCP